MNENIDLTKILKNCPMGWKLYSLIHGEVHFRCIDNSDFPIVAELSDRSDVDFTEYGRLYRNYDGECVLLPSKDQRDWSKFTAPWYKNEIFDPKTLNPFDKVLVRDSCNDTLCCCFFSHIAVFDDVYRYCTERTLYEKCIPYNDETKHLVGTAEEEPEYYRYWED